MKIELKECLNGYAVWINGQDPYVFKSTEILQMLEFIGNIVYGKKVQVKER